MTDVSVDLRNNHVLWNGMPDVVRVAYTRWQFNFRMFDVVVIEMLEQMVNAIQACFLFVHRLHHHQGASGMCVRSLMVSLATV